MLFQLVGGFGLLILGGEIMIRGASALAERLGVSPLVIGIVIVGFGTSAPELAASLQAALGGASGIAVGNIVGSNIANILLILGVGSLVYPITCPRPALARDGGFVIASALLLFGAGLTGGLGRIAGLVFVAGLVGYLCYLIRLERRGSAEERAAERERAAENGETRSWRDDLMPWVLTLAGLAAIIAGGKFLVDGAVHAALHFGVSEEVIGLTVVAFGTSLPELATVIAAGLKKQCDIALGNVLGSNIYNILGIGGITSLVSPLYFSQKMLTVDIPIMVGVSVLIIALAAFMKGINRWIGLCLLAGYCAYIAMLVS